MACDRRLLSAVSPDLDSMAVAPFRQQSHVEEVIVRTEERPLSTVTALRDVVWQGGDDGAGHASHGAGVPSIPRMRVRTSYVLDRRVSNSRELAWSCVWCPQIYDVTDDTTYSSGQARYAGVRCQYNNSCGPGSSWFEAHPTSSKFWDAAGGGECP